MKNLNLKTNFSRITGKASVALAVLTCSVMASPVYAAFDPTTIATEKADFVANVLVGTGMAVGMALVGAAGYILINFVRRGAR